MSDENERAANADDATTAGDADATSASDADATSASDAGAKVTERLDADGLPLDREPTIDDVRSQTGLHGRIGVGCVLVIVLLVAGFWLLRGGIIG